MKPLQLCFHNFSIYEILKMMTAWWFNIAKEFNKWLIKKEAINFPRRVAKPIREKDVQLSMLNIEDENEIEPFIDVIVKWSTIQRSFDNENADKKKTTKNQ